MTWDNAATRSELESLKIDLSLLNISQLVKIQHYIDKLIQERTAHIDQNKYNAADVSLT